MRSITKRTARDLRKRLEALNDFQWEQVYAGMYGAVFMQRVPEKHPVRFHIGVRKPKVGLYEMNDKAYLSYGAAREALVEMWMTAPLHPVPGEER